MKMKTSLRIIPALVANLFAATAVLAQDADAFKWKGEVGIGARGVSTDGGKRDGAYGTNTTPTTANVVPFEGPEDKAKFNEFRDLKDSTAIGIADVRGGNSRYFVNFYGENFFLKDQFLDLQGGRYGDFKYQLYNDRMPHAYSWGALTPMNGAGSSLQTAPSPTWDPNTPANAVNNPNRWNSVDVGFKRNTYGGNFEYSGNTPWYGRFEAQEYSTKGTRQNSYPFTNSSGNGWIDLAVPVDYRTRTLALEGGYKVKQGFIALNATLSNFYNDQEALSFQNPKWGNGLQTVPLPPDNEMLKWTLNGALRQLPLNSTLSGRWSYNTLKNSFNVQSVALNAGTVGGTNPGFSTTTPSSSVFNGKKTTNTGGLSWVANPLHGFDTKVFYNWYDRDNKSTPIAYAAGVGGTAIGALAAPDLFQYKNNNWGFDLGYRFNPANKLQGGYDDKRVSRTDSTAAPFSPGKTHDQKLWLEYVNNSLDVLTGKLRYERLDRESKNYAPAAYTSTTVTNVARMQIMDTANFNQDRIRLILDSTPMPLFDIGFQAIYKKTSYDNQYGGIQSDRRDEYTFNLSYGDAQKFRVSAFVDYETIKAKDVTYETGSSARAPWIAGWTPSGTDFQVWTTQKQTNKMFGIGADWPAMNKLVLNASYIWLKTGGGVDFSHNAPVTTGAAFYNGTLPGFVTDNTTKQSLVFKGRYDMDKKWAFTGGYAYERYKYDDDQMNGYFGRYPYYMVLSSTNTAIMNGVWTNPSYKSHVLWFTANYKFD